LSTAVARIAGSETSSGGKHVLARSNLFKVMSSRFVIIQIGWGAWKDHFLIIIPDAESIIDARIESDTDSSVNHLDKTKDAGNVIGIVIDFAKSGHLCFKVQLTGVSIGVHGNGPCGLGNVVNEVWVTDCAVNARTRV